MHPSVAIGAQSNQILFGVIAKVAPCLDVMDLQVLTFSTGLAAPSVTPQDLLVQLVIRLGSKAFASSLREHSIHGAVPTCWRTCSFCAAGSMPTSRCTARSKASGLPFSKFAPARKSAQIISRQ